MGCKQLDFSGYELTTAKKQTKREKFLSDVETVVPWQALIDLNEPHYLKPIKKGGWPPYPLAVTLRVHLLQQWYSLCDLAMEEALIEVPIMRSFAGMELISYGILDEIMVLTLVHLLEKHGLGQQIFEIVKVHLGPRGMTMRQGIIFDSSLIVAPSFSEGFAYGMKVHAGVDKYSGLTYSVVVTAANVDDFIPAAELLHGDEDVVYRDADYQGIAKRTEMAVTTTIFRMVMRPGKLRALLDTPEGILQNLIEMAKPHIRSKVQHPFQVIKQQFGFQKIRLRGLAENRYKINVQVALTNLFLLSQQLLAPG